jgi:hypothetical protein
VLFPLSSLLVLTIGWLRFHEDCPSFIMLCSELLLRLSTDYVRGPQQHFKSLNSFLIWLYMIKLATNNRQIATTSFGHCIVLLPIVQMNVKKEARFSEKRYLPTVQRAKTTPAMVPAKQIL